jgi:hypothetical protein
MARRPTLDIVDTPFGSKPPLAPVTAPASLAPAAVSGRAVDERPPAETQRAPASKRKPSASAAPELGPAGWRKVSVNMRVAQGLWDRVGELAAQLGDLDTNRTEITEALYWLMLTDTGSVEELVRRYRRLRADT